MSLTGIIAAVTALAKAIPALEGIIRQLAAAMERWDRQRNEKTASDRKALKDDAVDAGIDALTRRVFFTPPPEQLGAVDAATRLPRSGNERPRLDPGRAQDNQLA